MTRDIAIIFYAIFIWIYLSAHPSAATAQDRWYKPAVDGKIKSESELRLLLANVKNDTLKCNYLVALGFAYVRRKDDKVSDLDSAEQLLNQAYLLSSQIGSEKWKHYTLLTLAQLYRDYQKLPKQHQIYMQAIQRAQQIDNKQYEADAWAYHSYNTPTDPSTIKYNINYALKALKLYQGLDDTVKAAFTQKNIADYHLQTGNYNLAEKELINVLFLYKSIKFKKVWFSYDLLSAVYNKKGELGNALYYALIAVKTYEQQNKDVYPMFLRRVAEAYQAIGNTHESIYWGTKALNAFSGKQDALMIYTVLFELSDEMIENRQSKTALQLIKQITEQFPFTSDGNKLDFYAALGNCYYALGNYKTANEYYTKLINDDYLEKLEDDSRTKVYYNILKYSFVTGKFDQADLYQKKIKGLEIHINIPEQIQVNRIRAELEKRKGNFSKAIIYLETFHQLKDSLFSMNKTILMERLQVEFKSEQKENENDILRKREVIQLQELQRTKLIKNFIIGGIGVLFIMVILFYNRYRLKKHIHEILLQQKHDLDTSYHQLELSVDQKNRLLVEKEILIKEIHHRVKNNFQLTMSLLNTQSRYLQDDITIRAIKETQHRLKSIGLIHQKLYQTDNFTSINIASYIKELINYLEESMGYDRKITFELDLIALDLDVSQAVPLGLCLNEAVTNIYKYAFPLHKKGKVTIALMWLEGDIYKIEINDNGVGLPNDFDIEHCNSLGMNLLKGLSKQLDGELLLTNNDGLQLSITFIKTNSHNNLDNIKRYS